MQPPPCVRPRFRYERVVLYGIFPMLHCNKYIYSQINGNFQVICSSQHKRSLTAGNYQSNPWFKQALLNHQGPWMSLKSWVPVSRDCGSQDFWFGGIRESCVSLMTLDLRNPGCGTTSYLPENTEILSSSASVMTLDLRILCTSCTGDSWGPVFLRIHWISGFQDIWANHSWKSRDPVMTWDLWISGSLELFMGTQDFILYYNPD